jgi:hypothetical protein
VVYVGSLPAVDLFKRLFQFFGRQGEIQRGDFAGYIFENIQPALPAGTDIVPGVHDLVYGGARYFLDYVVFFSFHLRVENQSGMSFFL